MDPHAVTIFEIPLILALICELLDPAELRNCRRTCSLWDQLFVPYVWKDVKLCSNGMSSVEARDCARRNADWIRFLEINLCDTLFECPPTVCTRLLRLTCITNDTEISASAVEAGMPAYATNLIIRNRYLQNIVIDINSHANKYIHQPLLSALTDLKYLKSLELRIEGIYNATLVEAIARHCPVSVTSLMIMTKESTGSGAANTPELPVIEHVTDLDLPAWRSLTNLSRLTCAMYCHNQPEEMILFSLLRHSPNLHELGVPHHLPHLSSQLVDILTVEHTCPSIKQLRLPRSQALPQDLMIRLLAEYQDLVELEFFCGANWGPEVFEILLENSGDTLEILRYADERGPVVQRRHILDHIPMVLESCHCLKVLEVGFEDYAENVGVMLQKLVRAHWASDDLTTLMIVIRDIDKELEEEIESQTRSGLALWGRRWAGVEAEIKEVWDCDVVDWMDDLAEILRGFSCLEDSHLHWHKASFFYELLYDTYDGIWADEGFKTLDKKTFEWMNIPSWSIPDRGRLGRS